MGFAKLRPFLMMLDKRMAAVVSAHEPVSYPLMVVGILNMFYFHMFFSPKEKSLISQETKNCFACQATTGSCCLVAWGAAARPFFCRESHIRRLQLVLRSRSSSGAAREVFCEQVQYVHILSSSGASDVRSAGPCHP